MGQMCIKNCIGDIFVQPERYDDIPCNKLKIFNNEYFDFFGTNCASNTMLFISSLLSPGEAGLADVRPAFLFLGSKDSLQMSVGR
jgi:hypothetical protein